jgi:hypothetical protein
MRLLERTDDLGMRTTSATRLRFGLFALAVMTVTSCGGSGTAHPGHSPDTAGRQAIASGLSRSAGDKLVLDQFKSRGADLTKSRNVRNHLYFHAEVTARRSQHNSQRGIARASLRRPTVLGIGSSPPRRS